MNIVIQRNPMKPSEYCIKLLGAWSRDGRTLIRPAYTAGIGYATRDEAILALEANSWMDNRATWPARSAGGIDVVEAHTDEDRAAFMGTWRRLTLQYDAC